MADLSQINFKIYTNMSAMEKEIFKHLCCYIEGTIVCLLNGDFFVHLFQLQRSLCNEDTFQVPSYPRFLSLLYPGQCHPFLGGHFREQRMYSHSIPVAKAPLIMVIISFQFILEQCVSSWMSSVLLYCKHLKGISKEGLCDQKISKQRKLNCKRD